MTEQETVATPADVTDTPAGDIDLASELANLEAEPELTADPPEDVEPTAEAVEQAEAEPEEVAEDEAEAEPELEPEPEAAEPEQAEPEDKPDSLTARRLERIRKQEERARAAIAKEREAYQSQMQELAPQLEELRRFQELKSQVWSQPDKVLEALGVKPEEHERFSRDVFTLHKAATGDASASELAQRMAITRRTEERVAAAEKIALQAQQQLQEMQRQQQVDAYLSTVDKSVSEETPIVQKMMGSNPKKTRDLLRSLTSELLGETGEVPDPADVVAELELRRQTELEELGVDVSAFIKRAPKKTNPVADEKTPAKTITRNLRSTTAPKAEAVVTESEDLDALARELSLLE